MAFNLHVHGLILISRDGNYRSFCGGSSRGVGAIVIQDTGARRERRTGRLTRQLPPRGYGPGPPEKLAITKTFLARETALITVRVGPVTTEALPAAIVALFVCLSRAVHGSFFKRKNLELESKCHLDHSEDVTVVLIDMADQQSDEQYGLSSLVLRANDEGYR